MYIYERDVSKMADPEAFALFCSAALQGGRFGCRCRGAGDAGLKPGATLQITRMPRGVPEWRKETRNLTRGCYEHEATKVESGES